LSILTLGGATAAFADKPPLDCNKRNLANAVAEANTGDVISFTGVCNGPIVIAVDRLTLNGVGTAVIDGGSRDAVTVAGAHQVSMSGFEVRNGLSGIVGVNGAHITAVGLNVHDNILFGISLQTSSSAILSQVTTNHNGLHGLDLQTGSSATITGNFTSSQNRVFGINVNGSSLTLSRATVTANGNALGIQFATGANGILNDPQTAITVQNNFSVGLTVVSGAHVVSFGGKINASGHPLAGVSLNSKAGLDLDAGAQLNSFNNAEGVTLQEASVMTVFNNPQFSQVNATSLVNSHNNQGNGIRLQSGSTLTLSNLAQVLSTDNGGTGLVADNGVGITLVNSSLLRNTIKDLQMIFGARADLSTLTFGSYSCDATVLVRGTSGLVCPH
jgi:hypothetical protein